MIRIYSPENLMEAQCLKDMLERHHLFCHITGSDLIGGIGELPAIGLLALYVDDQDAGLAKELIETYLGAQPALEEEEFKQ